MVVKMVAGYRVSALYEVYETRQFIYGSLMPEKKYVKNITSWLCPFVLLFLAFFISVRNQNLFQKGGEIKIWQQQTLLVNYYRYMI